MQTAGARALRDDNERTAPPRQRFERERAGRLERERAGRFDRRGSADRGLVPVRAPDPERRTVTITGRPQDLPHRRRSATQEQLVARPDRVALWAFLLAVFLVLVAAATANAATL